jgi:hypothetical protein
MDLHARLGPFVTNGDPKRVERMLCRLVNEAVVHDSGENEWVVIRAARKRAPARGSS